MSFIQNETSSNPGGLQYRYLIKSILPLSFLFLVLVALKDAIVNYKLWRSL
jgi:TRAP-type mannitol/chloroaromatic compound transport system permease small subunit